MNKLKLGAQGYPDAKVYIESENWKSYQDAGSQLLEVASLNHKYIYDIFMIDTSGNILFALAEESDLGTNLISGKYRDSLFAKSVQATINDSGTHFSDVERYAPSNNTLAGFFSLPIWDINRNMVGVLAVQIKLDEIYQQLYSFNNETLKIRQYLVGNDMLLRSTYNESKQDVLSSTQNFPLAQKLADDLN